MKVKYPLIISWGTRLLAGPGVQCAGSSYCPQATPLLASCFSHYLCTLAEELDLNCLISVRITWAGVSESQVVWSDRLQIFSSGS